MLFFMDDSSSDEEREVVRHIGRRNLRDNNNLLDLPENEFMQYFRVSKEIFKMILESVQLKENLRATGIPPILQLAVTLNILAGGGYQTNVGCNKIISMCQTTVSKVFRNTIGILEKKLCLRWIRLKKEKFDQTQKYFFENFKIPEVIGIVGNTHISILRPTIDEHEFLNKKCSHSLNVMLICNYSNEIMIIDPTNGGVVPDSIAWKNSCVNEYLKKKYEQGCVARVLGDSRYPLLPWLLIPYNNPADESAEMCFNYVLAKARNQIERTIEMLKVRWKCLSGEKKLRYTPDKVASIINVCAALHNICLYYNIEIEVLQNNEQIIEDEPSAEDNILETSEISENLQTEAQLLRNDIKDSLYTTGIFKME